MIYTLPSIIVYNFIFLKEEKNFTLSKKLSGSEVLYNCGLPLMYNSGRLIESPSAKPYAVPLEYGIRKCDVSIITGLASSMFIQSGPLYIPFYSGALVSSATSDSKYHEEFQIIDNSSRTIVYRGKKINNVELSSFKWKINVINGKSPNTLFSVNGDGNSVWLVFDSEPTEGDPLISIQLRNIEFGGVPSPDY